MRLPIYEMTYRCRRCDTCYAVEWDPNRPGHVEPATACPRCAWPVRLCVGVGQKFDAERSAFNRSPEDFAQAGLRHDRRGDVPYRAAPVRRKPRAPWPVEALGSAAVNHEAVSR